MPIESAAGTIRGDALDIPPWLDDKRPMELRDLTHEERIALVGVIEMVLESDAMVSPEEQGVLGTIDEALGAGAYRRLADEIDRRFRDEEAVRAFLPSIGRQEARDLIYATALEAAIPEAIDPHESKLLEWLATIWNVSVQLGEG